jgi:hypothetical protein
MLHSVIVPLARVVMTDAPRKKIRLRAAAKLVELDPAYLSRLKADGTLEKEGLIAMQHPDYPDVVEFYEEDVLTWYNEHHAKRRRPRKKS